MLEDLAVAEDGLNAGGTVEEGAAGAAHGVELTSDEGVEVLKEVGDAAAAVAREQVVVGREELVLVELHPVRVAIAGRDDGEAEVDDAAHQLGGHQPIALVDAADGDEDGGVGVEVPRA